MLKFLIPTLAALLASMVVIATPAAVGAQDILAEGANGSSVSLTRGEPRGREGEDWTVAMAANQALISGGYSALRPHLPALKAALGRIPRRYPATEQRGRRIVIRADSEEDAMAQGLLYGLLGGMAGGRTTVESRPNVYPMIALILASDAVEGRRPEEAIGYLDVGLSRQPRNQYLTAEKAAALNMLGRHEEALAAIDAVLDPGTLSLGGNPALLQRHRGYALIELGRLDEAEAAYRASLEDDPGNATAEAQLTYIAQLGQGGEKREGVTARPPGAGPEANPAKPD